MNAVDTDVEGRDVAILGGGLAGLCLAIQLKQRDPSLAVISMGFSSGVTIGHLK